MFIVYCTTSQKGAAKEIVVVQFFIMTFTLEYSISAFNSSNCTAAVYGTRVAYSI